MSSLRNAISRQAHNERVQPQSRKKFGLLEKHKDYVVHAQAFHKKEEALRKPREKAAFRNPDEFYFKMIKTRTVDGVHKLSLANKYTSEELMLIKTQDIGYVLQKVQSEKKKIEKLTGMLHSLDNQPSNRHVYYAEDREEAKEIQCYIFSIMRCPSPTKACISCKAPDLVDNFQADSKKHTGNYSWGGEALTRKTRIFKVFFIFYCFIYAGVLLLT